MVKDWMHSLRFEPRPGFSLWFLFNLVIESLVSTIRQEKHNTGWKGIKTAQFVDDMIAYG